MKVYRGWRRNDDTAVVEVAQGGQMWTLTLGASLKLRNHSPTGFEWGYAGSGPAQLALALLLDAGADERTATYYYQKFKDEVVTKWDRAGWTIFEKDIVDWARKAVGQQMKSRGKITATATVIHHNDKTGGQAT